MKEGWLLYDACDYEVNRMFAAHAQKKGEALGISLHVVFTGNIEKALHNSPDFVISRQRNYALSANLESLGIPVFNSSRVCEICNDKRKTHKFLDGLPLMRTIVHEPDDVYTPDMGSFPLVVKPAFGHGGDRVSLVRDQAQFAHALSEINPLPTLVQEVASDAGKDIRIYILFGKIVAAVMRTAQTGIVSNFKKGGSVALHNVTDAETELAEEVIRRFSAIKAPLSFAGIDLMIHHGRPVVNEVEDVVGSRMLYKVKGPDIIDLYMQDIADALSKDSADQT